MEGFATKDRTGTIIAGKYRLDRRLGVGGMGEVYAATNTLLECSVAIKILRKEQETDSLAGERLLREARAARMVRHPNVVDVLDVGIDNEIPYMVQELLEGESLGDLLARDGSIPWQQAVEYLLPVAEAMGCAHDKGVLHRDLKPDNIFLARIGNTIVPKVLDFGISKFQTKEVKKLTATGIAMGTPAYMSPEQIQGERALTPATDVWSFGVVLYEVLAGQHPFWADSYNALFIQISTQPPPSIRMLIPTLPEEVSRVIDRCLLPDRKKRIANGHALAEALKAIPTQKAPPTPPPQNSQTLIYATEVPTNATASTVVLSQPAKHNIMADTVLAKDAQVTGIMRFNSVEPLEEPPPPRPKTPAPVVAQPAPPIPKSNQAAVINPKIDIPRVPKPPPTNSNAGIVVVLGVLALFASVLLGFGIGLGGR